MKKFIMLCGLPGTGKSTYITQLESQLRVDYYPVSDNDIIVISTDDILEILGHQFDMTYNELFDNITYSFAEKMMYKIAKHHFARGTKFVIWDQTNLTFSTRQKKLALVPKDYEKYCVYFEIPKDHSERLANRNGKTIPENVISSMKKSLQEPTVSEGFSEIIKILT